MPATGPTRCRRPVEPGGSAIPLLLGFAVAALLRAGLAYATEAAAFNAGAASRRRLRSDALTRLLHAGPALLRGRHSGDLAAIVVDRVEALDGLYARWIPAASFAVAGPVLVLLAALWADPFAALVLLLAGLLVPVGMAVAGIGAAAASRHQFLALARLQARFLDRVRGIATIVLLGRAECRGAVAGRGGRRAARPHHAGAARRLPVLRRAGPGRRRRPGGAGDPLRPGAAGRPPRPRPAWRCSCCCWCRSSSLRCAPSPPPTRTGCTPPAPPSR